MLQLQAFVGLAVMSSFGLWGLFPPLLTGLAVRGPDAKRNSRLLLLPALWATLLVIAALFVEPTKGAIKTADWVGYLTIPTLVAYLAVAVWSYVTLPRARGLATTCALANTPMALGAALVTAMAASGDWL
jgi:hypothetical protein